MISGANADKWIRRAARAAAAAKRAAAKRLLLAAKHSIFASSAFSSQLPILPTNNSVWVSLERKKIVTPGAN